MAFTYLQFHLVFVAPLLVAFGVTAATRRLRVPDSRRKALGVGILAFLAVAYTTPWDNLLIARGVWSYGPDTVVATIWNAPVEEYLFFVLQPVATALWLYQFTEPSDRPLTVALRNRVVGAAAGLTVSAVGVVLYVGADSTVYLGALLAWAGPVLAIQWAFGWPYLVERWRTVVIGVGLPTLYLCAADAIAIAMGIWTLSPRYTTGVTLAGLPVEEALFFLLTNLFVVQGLVLWLWVTERLEP